MAKKIIVSLIILGALLSPMAAMAQIDVFQACGNAPANDKVCAGTKSTSGIFGAGGVWNKVLNIITFIGGAAAVIVIIIAGMQYIFSGGNSGTVATAKNSIVYAVIGLVVAVSANVIVNFVLTNV